MKRTVSILLAAVIVLTLLCSIPAPASAASLYIRKVVSVVYDDSGSMSGDKWAYANYAMQAFCGMLNSEDQLYVTYMNASQKNGQYQSKQVDLSAGGIQNAVNDIRSHSNGGGTPYSAVDHAFEKLKSVYDSNPNTQYWLVVITDGDFAECNGYTAEKKKRFLNEHFDNYAKVTMPNGTKPQMTFLGIGNVAAPDQNLSKGIYTYSASDANAIIGAMSEMADRVSGRTRLQSDQVQRVDSTTLRVSSSIPLLNIAVLAQRVKVQVSKAICADGTNIPVSRQVSLRYGTRKDLVGGAFLLGDTQAVLPAGTYDIQFDQAVEPENVVILLEPALETRMTITVNGQELTDYTKLDDLMEKDKVSISCKLYEMGTDKEVDPALLPPGTRFEVSISENGKVVQKSDAQQMELKDYELKNLDTQITGAVIINGFNPIEHTVKFTPVKYVKRIVYTIVPSFGGGVKSIKYDKIAANKDMTVCFTVYADGVAMTDPNEVKALNPVIRLTPQGNDGTVSYTSDGKIVFTPTKAVLPDPDVDSFDVGISCTIADGTTVNETYTVLVATYEVFFTNGSKPVKKTALFGNQESVSFYITKDGVKQDKAAVESRISVLLNDAHQNLKTNVIVAPDGTITVTPYNNEEYTLNFWSWWSNWWYYFGLPGEDISVTLSHSYGTATATVDIVGEDAAYLIFAVWTPLILEIVIIVAIVAYIIRYVTKPRFAPNAALYVGSITRSHGAAAVHIMDLWQAPLKKYNKFKYLWNPFKELTVSVNGVKVTAAKGGVIQCEEAFPWYSGAVIPKSPLITINQPQDVVNHCMENDELEIQEIRPVNVMDEQDTRIFQDDTVYYLVKAEVDYVRTIGGQMEVIEDAVIFCYSTI